MSPSVARGLPNLRRLNISHCHSMEEVITEEEQQREGMMTLFPKLEDLSLCSLPKLRHFFMTEHALIFSSLREVWIDDCPEMKTFVQEEICASLQSVNNDDDQHKVMFDSKVSCPNLENLCIKKAKSMSAIWSHQFLNDDFTTLGELYVRNCGKLRNLMSLSVVRGLLNLRMLEIRECESMKEVIIEEEQQGEGIIILFTRLEELNLVRLPKLGHFFLTQHAVKFPLLREVKIEDCPEMKTFVQQGIPESTPSLESVDNDDEEKVDDLNKAMFNSKVSCPNLENIYINGANSISTLCSHQLPTDYFNKLVVLTVLNCGKLKNLMSSSVARGLQSIKDYEPLKEVITGEEKQGEGIITLFPMLEQLILQSLPKLRYFFLMEHTLIFPSLRKIDIKDCHEMKTFVQEGISVSMSNPQSVSNDDELNKAMFDSKVSCPNLENIYINGANNISILCSHQLPTAYFNKLVVLTVLNCGKLKNLMSSSVARGLQSIRDYEPLKEVITGEEKQGEGIITLFPMLEQLILQSLPKLRYFFLTEHTLIFPSLRKMNIKDCHEMKRFVQEGIFVSTSSPQSVSNDDDLNKAMFDSKVSCPNLEEICIRGCNNMSAMCSHQLSTDYFSELGKLNISECEKLRNLMSSSVAIGARNLQMLEIKDCKLMEEVIIEEEQQGEGIMTLFPLLENLELQRLPKLRHFFLTEHTLKFPSLMGVEIEDCPEMKTFVQEGICVSTPSLQSVMYGDFYDEVKVDDLNKWIHQRFTSKEQQANQSTIDGDESEASCEDESETSNGDESEANDDDDSKE